ncbi:MAG: prepilin-type N-terminal cleavage/methylation domain-containing protein [Sporichthyaceae bacterium]
MKRTLPPTTVLQRLSRRRQPDDRGLTLIELLMVITILGILAGIALFSARSFRGEATANANATDAEVLQTAQNAYCAQTGEYADRTRDLLTAPNDVLAEEGAYNATVVYTPDAFDFTTVATDTDPPSRYRGYREGGAGLAAAGPTGCGNRDFAVGPLEATFPGNNAQILTDDLLTGPVGFLSDSFRRTFGPIGFPTGLPGELALRATAPQTNDWAWISSTELSDAQIVSATRRQIGSGRLVLMACKSGGLSLPTTEPCRAPAPLGVDHFGSATTPGIEPTMANLVTLLQGRTTTCGLNPILVLQPEGTLFGNAARALLQANGLTTMVASLEALGCVVNQPDLLAARTQLRTGGSLPGSTTVLSPAKYALLSKAASTDPTAEDSNWNRDVTASVAGTLTPIPPILFYGGVLNRLVTSDPTGRAQATRFLNYLLSPLGQATLATYGYGPIVPGIVGQTYGPIPEL